MENQVKITQLQEQMKQVNEKLDSQDEKLDKLEVKIEKGFDEIKNELKCYVHKEIYAVDMENINSKLGKQSGNWDWVVKSIMSIIIGALIALVVKGI